jgi:hypothetical protein
VKIDTSHFTDAQYMTAQQKRRVLGDWVRFFAGGMKYERFTKRLYEHLTLHCSFIAHFLCAAGHKKCAMRLQNTTAGATARPANRTGGGSCEKCRSKA